MNPNRKLFKISTDRSNILPKSSLKDLILNVLKNILPEKTALTYVKEEYMPIWEEAFINETFNPTFNYEKKEYIGDRGLKIVYPKYVSKRNPDYTPMELANIDMLVMEKKNQYDLAFELGFINFIQLPHHQSVPVGVGGDVFESFFGALDEVSELVMEDMGLINSYNMITYIFNQNVMPDQLKKGNVKMVVEQIFIQLGLKSPSIEYVKEGKNITVLLNLKEQLEFFEQYGIHLPSVIGQGTAMSNKPALKIAYDNAKVILERNGVTKEFIEKAKALRKLGTEPGDNERPKVEKEVLDMDVKDLVLQLLKPIIKQKYVLNQFVEPRYMDLWTRIFDDKIKVDEKVMDKCYFFGEILIKGLIARHLDKMYKQDDYDKEDYNNMLSNIVQNYNLFLQEQPYSYLMNDRKLEGFVGVLDYISDELLMGSGMINCNKLIKNIFQKDLIPYEYRYTHPKTAVEQLFSPFFGQQKSKPVIDYDYDEDNALHHFKISLTDDQYNFLHQYGFKIKNHTLGESEGKLKNQTQKEAYKNALETLHRYGITKTELNKIKNKLDFLSPRLRMYYDALEKKRLEDGYDYFYFSSPIKTKTLAEATIQLVGVKGTKKTILSSIVEEPNADKMTSKVNLVTLYLGL